MIHIIKLYEPGLRRCARERISKYKYVVHVNGIVRHVDIDGTDDNASQPAICSS